MRLLSIRAQNFKLLEDVEIDFGTDRAKPLTVVRAENGSGKTSMLHALSWGFYGKEGLPEDARSIRLGAAHNTPGVPVEIKVTISFLHTDSDGYSTKYLLIRSVVETPSEGDSVQHSTPTVNLFQFVPGKGQDRIDESLILKFLPRSLQSVFFTDGDRVQDFITSSVHNRQKNQVHGAIRSLLNIDQLQQLQADAAAAASAFRKTAAKDEGSDVEKMLEALEKAQSELVDAQSARGEKADELHLMIAQREKWQTTLDEFRGLGDLEAINKDIRAAEAQMSGYRAQINALRRELRDLIAGKSFSWACMHLALEEGLSKLQDLSDRGIIPGTSLQVLRDRLHLRTCICGSSLDDEIEGGPQRRSFIENLVAEQQRSQELNNDLTELYYHARHELDESRNPSGGDDQSFTPRQASIRAQLSSQLQLLDGVSARRDKLMADRERIDDEQVQTLTRNLRAVEPKIVAKQTEILATENSIEMWRTQVEDANAKYDSAKEKVTRHGQASLERDIADDMQALVSNTLARLERDYVEQVAARMSEIFLHIVGADPQETGNLFSGVRIDPISFDIVVEADGGRTLDHAFEINGASQRALTLAFIWALMEVSGVEAPRIIDTPLGMVAGGVKHRLVEAITLSGQDRHPDFQVVLFLTRSEIRDIEDLLDVRASSYATLSSSKDFPADLRFDWGVTRPVVRVCSCNHRESCTLCARSYDWSTGVTFVEGKTVVS